MRWNTPPTPGVLARWSGYAAPSRHHLIDPIRPARGHTAISPHGGLYAMSSLCGSARRPASGSGFRCPFLPDMPSSTTPRSSNIDRFQITDVDVAFAGRSTAWYSQHSRNPFHAGEPFRGFLVRTFRPASLLAPLHGSDWDTSPANGSVYFQAFGVSVTLPAAGYNYSSNWTYLLAGLAPAGMKASFAARSPRYPGDPSRAFASVHDPGRIDAPSPIDGRVDAASGRTTAKASASWLYRGYCGASAPAAYASRMVLPPSMQGSLPAGWLAFAGRELNPLDRDEGFQITFSSPLPGIILTQHHSNLPSASL